MAEARAAHKKRNYKGTADNFADLFGHMIRQAVMDYARGRYLLRCKGEGSTEDLHIVEDAVRFLFDDEHYWGMNKWARRMYLDKEARSDGIDIEAVRYFAKTHTAEQLRRYYGNHYSKIKKDRYRPRAEDECPTD